MSTKADIVFIDNEMNKTDMEHRGEEANKLGVLYAHFDGYLEHRLLELMKFVLWFDDGRGINDLHYALARVVGFMDDFSSTNMLSYGISQERNKWAEFTYYLYNDGGIKAFCGRKLIGAFTYDRKEKKFTTIYKTPYTAIRIEEIMGELEFYLHNVMKHA